MPIRRGAKALGLKVDWLFEFIGPGTVAQGAPEAVFLDVGGHLSPGMLDQHQDGSLGASTSELVLRYPGFVYDHLMVPWLRRADDGQDLSNRAFSPVIVTHTFPDFDAVVSALLVMELVDTGSFPLWAGALVQYATEVDQGRYRVVLDDERTATDAVHIAYLALQHHAEEVSLRQKCVNRLQGQG